MPTFSAFPAEFMKSYAAANNKPSERAAKASILKHHPLPAFGPMPIDPIRVHAVESLRPKGLRRVQPQAREQHPLCLGRI
jgi:hypothetical protein